jgi:hypothetical protein
VAVVVVVVIQLQAAKVVQQVALELVDYAAQLQQQAVVEL